MSYAVRIPVYEGPFELLLHLILKEEVDIWDVKIAEVIDAFLVEVESIDRVDLDVATEFLLIASTLVELKVRRLLPGSEMTELDEELLRFEERDLLLARLLECKTFKDAARNLERMASVAARSYPRTAGLEEQFYSLAPDLFEGVDVDDIKAAYIRAMTPKPTLKLDLFHVSMVRASVTEAVEELLDELPRAGRINFRELTASLVERLEVVVRFLAVLELYKQGLVDIEQPTNFGEIEIVWIGDRLAGLEADLASIDAYDG
jgi:segregation and condensation protein A